LGSRGLTEEKIRAGERKFIFSAGAHVRDQVVLLKPRVMSLVVFTGAVGFLLVPGSIDWLQLAITLTAMVGGAGGCGALNMWWDADIDARMTRTAARPIPRGVITPREALLIGGVLSFLSVLALLLLVNWLSACLLALTIGIYVVVYTIWLKRRTPLNIVIGGAAGALPPMIGWAAASGSLAAEPLALFALIFVWTPPHFWSLAVRGCSDYERAGVPMMPNVIGPAATCRQILAYCLLLVPVSFAPLVFAETEFAYAVIVAVLDGLLIRRAVTLYRLRDGSEARRSKAAMALFGFSILYVFVFFVAMLVRALTR
jgi:protoheme IX farnesyltransferase